MQNLDLEALKRASHALSEEAGELRGLNRKLLSMKLAIGESGKFRETEEELELLHEKLGKSFLMLEDYTETFDFIIRLYERTEEELADLNAQLLKEDGGLSL